MPLEVPFRPSIVLAIVVAVAVVVDIVYVVVSRGRPLSLPSSNPHGSENPLAAKHRAFYVRSTEFFHGFRLALRRSFSQTARVCAHVLCTRVAAAAALSSVWIIKLVFLLTLHRWTESRQNTWEIKSARTKKEARSSRLWRWVNFDPLFRDTIALSNLESNPE